MDDLKLIKKQYGENLMHLCRTLFPTLLETPGLLYRTLTKKFNQSRFLYDDIVNNHQEDLFKEIIYNEADKEREQALKQEVTKTPRELLKEKGYTLYECKTEAEIQAFRHYYKKNEGMKIPEYEEGKRPPRHVGEEICTFDGGRLERAHVFFAVKDNAEKIKREKFNGIERREDEYGSSVLSIQFGRTKPNTPTIITRYNHTVPNPNATYGNDLNRIVEGLEEAFEKEYDLEIHSNKENFDIPGYVFASDGKFYKYNCEQNNIYYCPDNIIIDNGTVKRFDKSRYLVFETFIIDLQEKTIKRYDEDNYESFTKTIPKIEGIKIENIEDNRKKITINGDIEIVIDNTNKLKSYKNSHVTEIRNCFLDQCDSIESIDLENVVEIGNSFLSRAVSLKSINIPNCKTIGSWFLSNNKSLTSIDLSNVEYIAHGFMNYNTTLRHINLPKCDHIGEQFLRFNTCMEELDLPCVEEIDSRFLENNCVLRRINLPKCVYIGSQFLYSNENLEELELPSIEKIFNTFLATNTRLKKFSAPNLRKIGNHFLMNNNSLEFLSLPNLKELGDNALVNDDKLAIFIAPLLTILAKANDIDKNNELIQKTFQENLANYFASENNHESFI